MDSKDRKDRGLETQRETLRRNIFLVERAILSEEEREKLKEIELGRRRFRALKREIKSRKGLT
jgi:hypothetical protein